jgi:hypothetical protein
MNKMKKLITILLSITTISLSAQKLPNPPKTDAIGKESLWESFEKKDTYDILVRTKKIAILPVTSAYFAKKIDADSLQKFQNMLTNSSLIIQKAYYIGLIKKSLSAAIQNPEETNKILNQKGLLNPETVKKTPKNTLCFILGVDAVMFVDITMERLNLSLLNSFIRLGDYSDEIAIGLRLYEKSNGDFFWANRSSAKVLYLDSPDAALNKAAEVSFQSIPFIIR